MFAPISAPYKPESSVCKLPVFEPVRARVLQLFKGKPDVAQLGDLAALDPAITAELLAAANSPGYAPAPGIASPVYTAAEAIDILGWEESKRLVLLVFAAHAVFKSEVQCFVRAHWTHSLGCALVASQLAPFFGVKETRAFTFGMFHDIGAWGLMAQSPDAYAQLFAQGSRTCIEKLGAEECLMGIDHCKAGSWLVGSWGLPDEFAEASAMHYGAAVKGAPEVAAIVSVACRWADALGFCAGHTEKVSVRDALRTAPSSVIGKLAAASAEIGHKCRVQMLEYASEFAVPLAAR